MGIYWFIQSNPLQTSDQADDEDNRGFPLTAAVEGIKFRKHKKGNKTSAKIQVGRVRHPKQRF